ncbi:MAG: hypothetical protein ACP5N3_01560 [Candidatus Nanoarchaeia archaeon]
MKNPPAEKDPSKEIRKKEARREEERRFLSSFSFPAYGPLEPKKPIEFSFDRENTNSFSYPISIGNNLAEKKSDGYCVLIRTDRTKGERIRLYSSGGNLWSVDCFPELIKPLLKLPDGFYHGEILGLKPEGTEKFTALDEFRAIEKRPKQNRDNLTNEMLSEYPLKLDLFDVLVHNNVPLFAAPFAERRALLEKIIRTDNNLGLINQWSADSEKELQNLFFNAVSSGYEGLVVKDPMSLYVPGSRSNDWIKMKDFITLDLAVLGFYETPESKKAGKIFSSILVGTYNSDTGKYETIGKVKVSTNEDQRKILYAVPNMQKINDVSELAEFEHLEINPSIQKIERKIPDWIVNYPHSNGEKAAIVEVSVLDVTYSANWHSCGLKYDGKNAHALRIASYKQLRTDKTLKKDATTTQQVHELYG